jgi:hypothetical protein
MIDLQPQLIEAVVAFSQRLEVFDLKGHVVEPETAGRNRRGVERCPKQGEVMVNLAAGQENRLLRRFPCHLKAQHLSVELGGYVQVSDVQDQMTNRQELCYRLASSESLKTRPRAGLDSAFASLGGCQIAAAIVVADTAMFQVPPEV